MNYPIAETFVSFQGEGVFAGTPMFFIRLAGCTVGKPYPKEMYEKGRIAKEVLPIYIEKCTLYDGREFPCDTDYRKSETCDELELVSCIPEDIRHVCITGGEPLMHNLEALIKELIKSRIDVVHIETSGTVKTAKYFEDLYERYSSDELWISVSPKKGVTGDMLYKASEIKFLVDKDFDPLKEFEVDMDGEPPISATPLSIAGNKPTFLQPVNYEDYVNADNLARCVELQSQYRVFRLSPQTHKMVSYFIKEKIR